MDKSKKKLKHYQQTAVNELITYTQINLEKDNKTIIFQSPTGSGKTFMLSHYILNLIENSKEDLCFLWVSIGTGDLHVQSMKSVEREIGSIIKCSLLEETFFGSRSNISQNEIVFLNWEKIRAKDSKTGEYKSILMKDRDDYNFIEVLKNTRKTNRKIILIIDESHYSSTTLKAREIRDEIIKPNLTIEMSATPILNEDMEARVVVPPNKVIEEEMIKKEIIINSEIEQIVDNEMDSEELILNSAYLKRKKLKQLYIKNNSKVNPLVLIQIPNAKAGDLKKESVIKFLKEKNITVENEKLAIWLSEEEANKESEKLLKLDGKVEYLIFKKAIDTGWDCPRAQILVKFRETKSITFEIQTVGRILRMPEIKHYKDDELNRAFVYTNIQNILIKKEIYNPNILKSLFSKRTENYNSINLKSYYKNRVDFGDITRSFYLIFENVFCDYFGIEVSLDGIINNTYDNMEKLREKGISIEETDQDEVISNLHIESDKIDLIEGNLDNVQNISLISTGISMADLEIKFENIIKENLNGFAPKRSIPTVKQAIITTLKNYLGLKTIKGGIVYIQNLVIQNYSIFEKIINSSTEKYKPLHEMQIQEKNKGRYNENWEIENIKHYNPETNKIYFSELSLYQPLYMEIQSNNKLNQLETTFIDMLDKHKDKVNWFWKNGAEHMESNFGIKKENGYTFQPDFIINFKNGLIGIFDTKAGKGFNENDNADKSNALYTYISEENNDGKKLIGGLVIFEDNKFRYISSPIYESYEKNKEKWKDFDELLK